MENIISVTGHRELSFFNPVKLIETIKRELTLLGCEKLLTGMAQGADTYFALAALELNIPFESIIPFKGQDTNWSSPHKETYEFLLSKADRLVYTSNKYHKECFFVRDQYLVDNSNVLVSLYDGRKKGGTAYTVNYAMKQSNITKHVNLWDIAQKECQI